MCFLWQCMPLRGHYVQCFAFSCPNRVKATLCSFQRVTCPSHPFKNFSTGHNDKYFKIFHTVQSWALETQPLRSAKTIDTSFESAQGSKSPGRSGPSGLATVQPLFSHSFMHCRSYCCFFNFPKVNFQYNVGGLVTCAFPEMDSAVHVCSRTSHSVQSSGLVPHAALYYFLL